MTQRTDPELGSALAKDWTVKYLQFTWNVNHLRSVYAPATTSVSVLENTIAMTMASCWALSEWLVEGGAPGQVSGHDLAALLDHEPLKVAKAFAHGAGAVEAHIVTSHIGGSPARAWIEYSEPGAALVRFDALDLAERSLAAWNGFLRAHDVLLPNWSPA